MANEQTHETITYGLIRQAYREILQSERAYYRMVWLYANFQMQRAHSNGHVDMANNWGDTALDAEKGLERTDEAIQRLSELPQPKEIVTPDVTKTLSDSVSEQEKEGEADGNAT